MFILYAAQCPWERPASCVLLWKRVLQRLRRDSGSTNPLSTLRKHRRPPQPPQDSFFSRAGAFIPGTRYFSGWYNVVSSLSSSFTALPALANEIPPAVATPGPPLATAWLPEGFVSSPSPPASPRSPSGPRPSPAPPACTDVPPSADYTCAQQAGWGKCKYAAWCLDGMSTHALGPGHCLACAGGLEQQMSTWIGR